jgi:hypothetical protein
MCASFEPELYGAAADRGRLGNYVEYDVRLRTDNDGVDGQGTAILRAREAGAAPAEACRKDGINRATFFEWFGRMLVSDARRLRALERPLNLAIKPAQ